jgi:hypothetical protein
MKTADDRTGGAAATPTPVSKQRRAYCRKLYLAWLITQERHDLASLQRVTGMPRRTLQDTLADLGDIGIVCRFVQDGPRNRHGYYRLVEWGDHDAQWIARNIQAITAAVVMCSTLS